MFCEKCGEKLEEDAMFCAKCGMKVEDMEKSISLEQTRDKKENDEHMIKAEQQIIPFESEPINKKKKKINLKLVMVCIISIAIITAGIIYFQNRRITLSMNDYIRVDYSGYDTLGEAKVTFDREAFLDDYEDKIKFTSEGKENFEYLSDDPCEIILDKYIDGELDKTEKLSENDKILYEWDCDDEYVEKYFKCKLEYANIEYSVNGLDKIEQFDPFENVDVLFTGSAPNGKAEIVKGDEHKYEDLTYSLDVTDGLKNGDTVIVKVSYSYGNLNTYCIENYKAIPKELTKTYTVGELGSYATSMKDISEDLLSAMKKETEDKQKAYAASNWSTHEKLEKMTYVGCYFLKPKQYVDETKNNIVQLVYKIDASDNFDDENIHQKFSYYYTEAYYDVIVLPDGKCSVDLTDCMVTEDSFNREVKINEYSCDNATFVYYGYEKIETLFNRIVTSKIDKYEYETDIKTE